MAGYDPQRGRARPRIGDDEPAAVDGLLGDVPPAPPASAHGDEAPVDEAPAAASAPVEVEPVTAEPGGVEPAVVDEAERPVPVEDRPAAEPVGAGPAPAQPSVAPAADAPAPAEALQEALAPEAATGELVVVPPAGRTVEGRAVGAVAVPERRTFVPRPAALVVFLLALVAAVVLALRLRRRRSD